MFAINTRVVVVHQNFSPENYDWVPDLVGKQGIIEDVIDDLDEPLYWVKFDEMFEVHETEPERDTWMLTHDELRKINKEENTEKS